MVIVPMFANQANATIHIYSKRNWLIFWRNFPFFFLFFSDFPYNVRHRNNRLLAYLGFESMEVDENCMRHVSFGLHPLSVSTLLSNFTGWNITKNNTCLTQCICVAEFTGRQAQHNNLNNGKNRRAWLGSALKHVDKPVSC